MANFHSINEFEDTKAIHPNGTAQVWHLLPRELEEKMEQMNFCLCPTQRSEHQRQKEANDDITVSSRNEQCQRKSIPHEEKRKIRLKMLKKLKTRE